MPMDHFGLGNLIRRPLGPGGLVLWKGDEFPLANRGTTQIALLSG